MNTLKTPYTAPYTSLHTGVECVAHPSLALIKYWGKLESSQKNIPATTSIAITLRELCSRVKVSIQGDLHKHEMSLDGNIVGTQHISELLEGLCALSRSSLQDIPYLSIEAKNNFPSSSGLASSSSGFAALSLALSIFCGIELDTRRLSELARVGSGSACRSVIGGFALWERGSRHAVQIESEHYWDNLRVIVFAPYPEKKEISSRDAMNRTASTSSYFERWVHHNEALVADTLKAISDKDLEKLGCCMRSSYLAMHASAMAAQPPIMYMKEKSLTLLEICKELRKKGVPAWETMDAGPQVKVLSEEAYVDSIIRTVLEYYKDIWYRVSTIGGAARCEHTN